MRLLDAWKWKSLHHVWLLATPWTLCPWNSPGQNTGVGSPSLLQGNFPTQEWDQRLLHCRWILYQLSYQGSPTVDSVFLQKLPRGTCLILCLFPVHPGEQTRNPHHPHPTPHLLSQRIRLSCQNKQTNKQDRDFPGGPVVKTSPSGGGSGWGGRVMVHRELGSYMPCSQKPERETEALLQQSE